MFKPEENISQLPKIGEKQAKVLSGMGIGTVADLLLYFPTRYLDFSKFSAIRDLVPGEVVTIRGTITSISSRFSFKTRKTLAEATVSDGTGKVKITWFNQGYVADALAKGDEVLFSGKAELYKNSMQLINPIYERVTAEHLHTGRLVPIYKLPEGIYPKTFRKLIHSVLDASQLLAEPLPQETLEEYGLLALAETIQELHFPSTLEMVERAQYRLTFEESLTQQLAVLERKRILQSHAAPSIPTDAKGLAKSIRKLPFTLTAGQETALQEITTDLTEKHPMNRLLQGDVGSGKTIVALLAALSVLEKGYQVVLVAPTEVLAKQHFISIIQTLRALGKEKVLCGLYTRNFRESPDKQYTKAEITKAISTGVFQLVIGTHALLQEGIQFHNVAFVIIDEQHRFGVRQRATAISPIKNSASSTHAWVPHLLSMSATPIPRTAALAMFGDLDVSTIPELPQNRLPIKTWVIPEAKRAGAYEFIAKEITTGKQAFIVTPLVEESEKLEAKAAKVEFERLQKEIFPHHKLALLYGGMKGADKDQVMSAFKSGTVDILVATSVIEIGIDIPSATVMLIESAERFGLAQLHQLRGRVGRGEHQSYCFLFTENPGSKSRLDFFSKTMNGFTLAEYDMKARGFGSLFGSTQTGFEFRYGQFLSLELIAKTRAAATELLRQNKLSQYTQLSHQVQKLISGLHME